MDPKVNRTRLYIWLLACVPLVGGSIEGSVTSSVTGTGIPGVEVTVQQLGVALGAVTNDQGLFFIADVVDGDYWVLCQKQGFSAMESTRPLSVHGDARVEESMIPLARLHGRVVDPEGKPAAGVEVELLDRRASTATDAEGNFAFENIRAGMYWLVAKPKAAVVIDSDGQEKATVPTYYPTVTGRAEAEAIKVQGSDLGGYEIRLQKVLAHPLRGLVIGEDGKPAENAAVILFKEPAPPVTMIQMRSMQESTLRFGTAPLGSEERATTDKDGRFEFAAVPEGLWRVRVLSSTSSDDAQYHYKLGGSAVETVVSKME